MTASPLASVVVPTRYPDRYLASCLASLRGQGFPSFEVIVVEDGCPGEAAPVVAAALPGARIVPLEGNRGFAAACNAGARRARGRFLAFLNDDAQPRPAWLAELVACAERHRRAASVACKVLCLREPTLIDGAGDVMTRSFKAYRRGQGEPDRGQYDREEEVFSASGTACLWRTQVFRELGGFDETFFAYYEDVDLGFRARLAGYECWYAPRAVALHLGQGTSGDDWSRFRAYYSTRNRWATIAKNVSVALLVRRLPLVAVAEALALARAARHGEVGQILRAYRAAAGSARLWRRAAFLPPRQAGREDVSGLVERALPPMAALERPWRLAARLLRAKDPSSPAPRSLA